MDDLAKPTIAASVFILFYSMIAKRMQNSICLPDPMVMMLYGIVIGQQCLNLLRTHYLFSKRVISYLARLLLCLQTMAVAISLPGGYVIQNAKSIFLLVVIAGFIKCGLIFSILKAVSSMSTPTCWAIAASLTPTDPILSSSIIKGRFASAYVPRKLQTLLSAESGINDGLGIIMLNISVELLNCYPTVFGHPAGGFFKQNAWRFYFPVWDFAVNTIGKRVVLSSLIGYLIGLVMRKITKACCAIELIRSEILTIHSFILTALGLALMDQIGGSELICIFFIGTALNADDWYSLGGSSKKISEIIESLFSSVFFVFIGAILDFSRISLRIILICMLIIVVARPLSILVTYRFIPLLERASEALFIGWFGPIGVSAIYYCILYDRTMNTITFDFAMCVVLTSTFVHGASVPIFCLGQGIYQACRHIAAL